MAFITPANSGAKPDMNLGGKASNLLVLQQLGLNVPAFVIIPSDFFLQYIPKTLLETNDATQLKSFIQDFEFDTSVFDEIKNVFAADSLLAVRSSANDEDGSSFSFAGQFETKLFVKPSQLLSVIKEVWLSVFNERVLTYRKTNHLKPGYSISIVVQQMIHADVSGVAFGANPLTQAPGEKVINAVFGVGEGLVSGELNADMYILKNDIVEKHLVEKTQAMVFDDLNGFGNHFINLEADKALSETLSDSQLHDLSTTLDRLHQHFKCAQDIEFAYKDDVLYLLQSRAITTIADQTTNPQAASVTPAQSPDTMPLTEQQVITWDNSNIIESYPNTTLPLTFSFIAKMYEAVYIEMSAVMGIPAYKVEKHKAAYANMLGLLKGRVYYNLNSWYKVLSLLPGYNINAQFMENMMGVKERFQLNESPVKTGFRDYWEIVVAVRSILKNHRNLNRQRIEFQAYFNAVMNEYNALDLKNRSIETLLQDYTRFEQTLVTKWKAPLVNDFFCMIYFGLLQKLVKAYKLDDSATLHNDLVSGAKDIVSTEPITLSLEISDKISEQENARHLFLNEPETVIWQTLHNAEYKNIKQAIDRYIANWGERCVGELKLETITYKQSPELYIKILKSYVKKNISSKQFHPQNKDIRLQAETLVKQKLKGKWLKKRIFNYVLKKARYLVSNRENLRYERTRGFGMVRILFVEIGEKLHQQKAIDKPRDVFYLTQQEITDFVKGTAVNTDLKALINLRKQEYTAFDATLLPERIVTKGAVNTADLGNIPLHTNHTNEGPPTLKGVACCAGIVKARVQVIHSPGEIESLNGDILVTSSTDPGWVTLFPTASAILVERGSLLSHSAIVSREMGIPCIVGVTKLLQILKTGDMVEMDGATGIIKLVS